MAWNTQLITMRWGERWAIVAAGNKGYINQRAVLVRRAEAVDRLFAAPVAPGVLRA